MGKKTEDFLLEEYRIFAESFWRNEESGERRVNFLITLVTAVIGAAVALVSQTELSREAALFAVLFALLGLLTFGVVTLLRMIRRNRATDEYKRAMDLIRAYFTQGDERLREYDPFPKRAGRKAGTGGLVDMVSLINSLVVLTMGVFFGLLFHLSPIVVGIVGCTAFAVSEVLHYWYVKRQYQGEAFSDATARK